MDSVTDDELELEVDEDDLWGMELDDSPLTSSPRDDEEGSGQAEVETSEESTEENSGAPIVEMKDSDVPTAEQLVGVVGNPKKKKRNYRRSMASLERKRLRRKEMRKLFRDRLCYELEARAAAATGVAGKAAPATGTSTSSLDDTLRSGPVGPVRNLLSAGYNSFYNDANIAEEMVKPEDQPWTKGHEKRLAPPPVALEPPTNSDKVILGEQMRQRYYESPSTKLAKYVIRDKWKLTEREILLKDHHEVKFPRQMMPNDTIGRLKEILKDPKRVSDENSQHNHKYINRKPADDDKTIRDFLWEVRRTRVMCVSTVGTWTCIGKGGKDKRPLAMVALAALNGVVLFFNDHENIPLELMQLLSDVSITKIGNELSKVISELERVGVTLDNWVATGAVRLALYSRAWDPFIFDPARPERKPYTFGARGCGMEEQVEDLRSEGYLPQTFNRTAIKGYWKAGLDQGIVPYKMWPHIWENGRIPCVYLLMIVLDFARMRKLPDETPAMGILHEALALCRGRDPDNFPSQLEPSIRPHKWWFAHPGSGTQMEKMQLPADCHEMVSDRRTFADFVEPLTLEDPESVARRVYLRFFGSDPVPFPSFKEVDRDIKHTLTTLRCICCGSRDHISDCPKVKKPFCEYEHDGEEGLRSHTTEFCPVLHNYCGVCQTVGHHERVHSEERFFKTGRELRERFFRYMAIGAYTSLPYLAFHPEGYKRLTGSHWRRSYDGKAFRHATITRYVLGIGPEIQAKLAEQAKSENRSCDSYRDWQLEVIRENIERANTGDTVPLPRDLLTDLRIRRQEQESLLKQAQIEADRETRHAAAREQASLSTSGGVENKAKKRRRKNKLKPNQNVY